MKCRKSERLMTELLESPGDSPEWRALEEHLSDCLRCQESFRMLQFSRLLLERPSMNTELGPYFVPRLMARVRELREAKEMDWGLIWRFSRRLMAFSFLLLLLLVGTLFYEFASMPQENPVVVDGVLEPSFSDRSVNEMLLQTDHPQKDQVLEALLSPGEQHKR